MRSEHATHILIVACLAGVILAGCGASQPASTFDDRLLPLYEDAKVNGATEEALDVLRAAAEDGVPVTFEQVREAQLRTVDCLRDLGLDVRTNDDPGSPGGLFLMYGLSGHVGDLPVGLDAAAVACQESDSVLVDIAYQLTNAKPLDALDVALEPYRADLIECVRERGGFVDESGTARELLEVAATTDLEGGWPEPCTTKLGIDQILADAS